MAEPSAADAEDPRLILLDPRDNVLVVRRALRRATRSPSAGAVVSAAREIADGPQGGAPRHRGRREGAEIRRADRHGHGRRSPSGEHVHVHNVQERLHADLYRRRAQHDARKPEASAMTGRAPCRAGCARTAARASATPWPSAISSSARTMSPARSRCRSASDDVHVIGFPGCYPERLRRADDGARCARIPMSARCCWSRSAARASTNTGSSAAVAGHAAGRCRRIVIQATAARAPRSPRAGPGSAQSGRPSSTRSRRCRWRVDELVVGTVCGGSDGTSRHHRQSRRGPRLRHAGRGRRRLHLRGDRRAHRLRAHHGVARRSRRRSAHELEASVAKAARYYATLGYGSLRRRQRRGRAHDHRGEVDGRLRQVRRVAHLRPDQARRHAAARRALSARRGARRRGRASASPTSTTTPRSPS